MSLQTFEVPWNAGCVRTVTSLGEGKVRLTVECFDLKTAFTIEYDGKQRVWSGDWIKFKGQVRMNPGLRKTGPRAGEPLEENLAYYHDPIDGTNKSEWLYFDLLEAFIRVIGPLDLIDTMVEAISMMRRHLDSWQYNNSAPNFLETENAVNEAHKAIHQWRRKLQEREDELNAPVKTLDITV